MLILSIREKEIDMSAPIIRSSTDIRRDYNSIEMLAKETGKPIYLTKNGRASLVVMGRSRVRLRQVRGIGDRRSRRVQQEAP